MTKQKELHCNNCVSLRKYGDVYYCNSMCVTLDVRNKKVWRSDRCLEYASCLEYANAPPYVPMLGNYDDFFNTLPKQYPFVIKVTGTREVKIPIDRYEPIITAGLSGDARIVKSTLRMRDSGTCVTTRNVLSALMPYLHKSGIIYTPMPVTGPVGAESLALLRKDSTYCCVHYFPVGGSWYLGDYPYIATNGYVTAADPPKEVVDLVTVRRVNVVPVPDTRYLSYLLGKDGPKTGKTKEQDNVGPRKISMGGQLYVRADTVPPSVTGTARVEGALYAPDDEPRRTPQIYTADNVPVYKPEAAAKGAYYYDSTTNKTMVYDGEKWVANLPRIGPVQVNRTVNLTTVAAGATDLLAEPETTTTTPALQRTVDLTTVPTITLDLDDEDEDVKVIVNAEEYDG